jgi:YidC/Oxa1 family membrane protein insertase
MSNVLDALFDAVAGAMAFFYSLWPSYGVSIILLTLSVMVLVTPLTLKGTKSMMAMQRLQPEMKKIQEKYKDDREKLNEELLAFYKENSINPVGGCLPLFLQMPVFIVLYRVVSGLTLPGSDMGAATGFVSSQLATGTSPLTGPSSAITERPFDPAYLDHTSEMYQSLIGKFEMPFLGLDLAESTSQALSAGIVTALPYLLAIGIVAFTGWYQQRQMQARNTAEPNPQQQMISRVMLFVLPVISFGLPMGVVLYFIVSNLYRVGQQYYITRTMYRGDDPIPAITVEEKKAPGKGGGNGSAPSGSGAPKKPKPAPKTPAGTKPVKPNTGSGRVTPAKNAPASNGRGASGTKKTFTSDARRKTGGADTPPVTPRARKKRK